MKSQDKDQYIPTAPQCPDNLKETGLNSGMLSEMVLKAIYTKGAMLGMDISNLYAYLLKSLKKLWSSLKTKSASMFQVAILLAGPVTNSTLRN